MQNRNTPKTKNRMYVLYVDDDEDDREIFTELVKEINPQINVITARDGGEAIDILTHRSASPQAIFLDINMPLKNGFETLVEIRKIQELRDTKIIMYSTNVDPYIEGPLGDSNTIFVKKYNTVEAIKESLASILG